MERSRSWRNSSILTKAISTQQSALSPRSDWRSDHQVIRSQVEKFRSPDLAITRSPDLFRGCMLSADGWRLLTRDRHARNAQRRARRRAAELKVAADFRNVVKHVFEIAGDCDFFHGKCQRAVFDPQPAGATGEVSGNQVHAEAEK